MERIEEDTRSQVEVTVHTVFFTLATICSLVGNSLVCLAFYRNSRLRTITNFYVLSLAAVDMMMSAFNIPFLAVASGLRRWPFGYNFCQFSGIINVSWAQISTSSLAFASVNRYFCVVKPHRYSTFFTRKRTILSIVAAWIFSFVLTSLFFAAKSIYKWSPDILNCVATYTDKQTKRVAYLFFACVFLVPMTLIVFCYSRVYRVIRQHNNVIVPSLQVANCQQSQGMVAQEIKTSRILLAAVFGFCGCWTPIIFLFILEYGFQIIISSSAPFVNVLVGFLCLTSAWINPLIYGVMNRTMRKEFLNILFCRKS